VTWWRACWLLGWWWTWSEKLECEVDSLCVLGFCFERPTGRTKQAEVDRLHAPSSGCGARLAPGQYWTFCGETDMGQTLPALCTRCSDDGFTLLMDRPAEEVGDGPAP
jgi:hypothetical protein